MIFKNARVFYQGSFQSLDVRVEDDLITEVGANLLGEEEIDCFGKILLPGLIEVHSHGVIGYDFSCSNPDQIEKMRVYYQQHGVTSIVATTMTAPLEEYRQAVISIRQAMVQQQKGARLMGINMEGPFLAKNKKGAHDERYLYPVDTGLFQELNGLCDGSILIVDLDPDLEGAMDFIRSNGNKVTCSIAHTSCTYQTAMDAIAAGATEVTHLYNAMNGLHHREPGIVGAVFDSDQVRAELICDGIHVNPSVIRLSFKAFGEKIILISDSMCACGLDDGEYELGGQKVFVHNRKATLESGTIAGSATNVYDCMVHAIGYGVKPEQAILSATLNPAKAIRADDRIGSIESGKKADLLVVSPEWVIERIYQDGILVKE